MKVSMAIATLGLALAPLTPQSGEAPTGFDNKSNGMVDDTTHQGDQAKFDEIAGVADGLGPLYNAQSCRECHQNPTSGGGSQITETAPVFWFLAGSWRVGSDDALLENRSAGFAAVFRLQSGAPIPAADNADAGSTQGIERQRPVEDGDSQ